MSNQNRKTPEGTIVKKVKAYPIPALLKIGSANAAAQIVKLTLQGFLAEVSLKTLQPGDRFEISFELPVFHKMINEPVVLVKLYNQWSGQGADPATTPTGASDTGGASSGSETVSSSSPTESGVKVVHLAEIHFQSLSAESKEKISNFHKAIQQKT